MKLYFGLGFALAVFGILFSEPIFGMLGMRISSFDGPDLNSAYQIVRHDLSE